MTKGMDQKNRIDLLNRWLASGLSPTKFAKENGLRSNTIRELRAKEIEALAGEGILRSSTPGGKALYLRGKRPVQILVRRNLTLARKAALYGGKPVTQTVVAILTGATQVEVSAFERGAKYDEGFAAKYAMALGYTMAEVSRFGFQPRQGEINGELKARVAGIVTDPIVWGQPRRLTPYGIAGNIKDFVGVPLLIEKTGAQRDGHPIMVVRTGTVMKGAR